MCFPNIRQTAWSSYWVPHHHSGRLTGDSRMRVGDPPILEVERDETHEPASESFECNDGVDEPSVESVAESENMQEGILLVGVTQITRT